MKCPHCQIELPENFGAQNCLACGISLSSPKFKSVLFLFALLLPPVLTLLSAMLMRTFVLTTTINEGVTPWVVLLGGGLGGIICGVLLGIRIGGNVAARISLSILFSAIMIVVCIVLCFVGCNLGGYQMNFH